jgi:hypothetical protein
MAAMVLGFAGGALAADAPAKDIPKGGLTLDETVSWLQGGGYKAEVKTLKSGDRYISTAAEGMNFDVYLDDCKDKRCASLEFVAGFDLKGGMKDGPKKVGEWNQNKRWLRAYLDDERDPWCVMDVSLEPGRSFAALDDDFAIWRTSMTEFKTFIGW